MQGTEIVSWGDKKIGNVMSGLGSMSHVKYNKSKTIKSVNFEDDEDNALLNQQKFLLKAKEQSEKVEEK